MKLPVHPVKTGQARRGFLGTQTNREWGQIFILHKDGVKRVSIWFALKRTESKVKDKDLNLVKDRVRLAILQFGVKVD